LRPTIIELLGFFAQSRSRLLRHLDDVGSLDDLEAAANARSLSVLTGHRAIDLCLDDGRLTDELNRVRGVQLQECE